MLRLFDACVRTLPVACLLLCMRPLAAAAHPHMFIFNQVKAAFDSGRLLGFSLDWLFDDLSTQGFLPRRNPAAGPLTPAEIAHLQRDAFSNLKKVDYFVHVWQNGRKVKIGKAQSFTARFQGDQMDYRFYVPLVVPIDTKQGPILADFYDETYFVDLSFNDEPKAITLASNPPSCTAKMLDEDPTHRIPFWGVHPEGILIRC